MAPHCRFDPIIADVYVFVCMKTTQEGGILSNASFFCVSFTQPVNVTIQCL